MRARHIPVQLPRLWLMTDERMGDALLPALARLPKGAGVIFRHYSLPAPHRRALFAQVRRIARARRLTLVIAGPPRLATAWRANGSHGRHHGALTAPVHDMRERIAAERAGARLLLVSPVHPTRSHPGAKALGKTRFGLLIRSARQPVIALGGMDAARARALSAFGIFGWAAIDAYLRPR